MLAVRSGLVVAHALKRVDERLRPRGLRPELELLDRGCTSEQMHRAAAEATGYTVF